MFILDFLCIHPFSDGNGRMSRLLTLLLLYRAGFLVGKYVSIEKIICDTKDGYYEALRLSSINWHEEKNDYAPFVTYMLGTILAAHREFENRLALSQIVCGRRFGTDSGKLLKVKSSLGVRISVK